MSHTFKKKFLLIPLSLQILILILNIDLILIDQKIDKFHKNNIYRILKENYSNHSHCLVMKLI